MTTNTAERNYKYLKLANFSDEKKMAAKIWLGTHLTQSNWTI